MSLFILLFINNPSFADGDTPNKKEKSEKIEKTQEKKSKDAPKKSGSDASKAKDTATENDTGEEISDDTEAEKEQEDSDTGGETSPPKTEKKSSFAWGTLFFGLIIGAIGGFFAGNKNSSPPAQDPPKRKSKTPSTKREHVQQRPKPQKKRTQAPQHNKAVIKPVPQTARKPQQEPPKPQKPNNAIKISPSQKPNTSSKSKPTPSKGIRIGSAKPKNPTPKVARIPSGLRIEEYLHHLLQHFPKIANELSTNDRSEFTHVQRSFQIIIKSFQTHQNDDFQKMIKRELIPALDDTALLISKISEKVYLENKDSDYLEWLLEILFSHISQECTRLQLFSIHEIIPFQTDFDPSIHHAISASQCGYDFENKIISISKLQLSNPSTDEIIRSAEVIVGK